VPAYPASEAPKMIRNPITFCAIPVRRSTQEVSSIRCR
jgi:hypothetical protein